MCLSLFKKWLKEKNQPLLLLKDLQLLTERCPYCQKPESDQSVCYYDIKENGGFRYEFICSECARVFSVELTQEEFARRSKERAVGILRDIRAITQSESVIQTLDKIELNLKEEKN